MTVDMKRLGDEVRGRAAPEEADSTIHVKHEKDGATLTLSVDPAGEVDMTYFVANDKGAVTIHGGEAIVQGPGGDVRFYRLDDSAELGAAGEQAGDMNLIRSAKAMLDREVDSIGDVGEFERFSPFEDA